MQKSYPKSAYSEKLLDPRWQKKRLEILNRDEFTCQKCFDSESTLNVHHCYYSYGTEPWDYPDTSLKTLCVSCHKEEEPAKDAKSDLITILSQKGLFYNDFHSLASGFMDFRFDNMGYTSSMLEWALKNDNIREIMEEEYSKHMKQQSLNRKTPL